MNFKKIKKIVALSCVATTLIPANIVSAATLSGDSTIENSNASAPTYTSVVLPTSNANIYDFTIDRSGLLAEHGDATKYDSSASGVFFNTLKTAAKLTPANADNAFYILDAAVLSDADTVLTAALASGLAALDAENYYVWQPDISTDDTKLAGAGTWTKLTSENAEAFLDVTFDTDGAITAVAVRTDNLAGADVFDGKVYEEQYVALTDAEEAAKYVTLNASGDVDTISTDLFIGLASNPTDYTNPTASDVTYTAADYWYTGTSDEAKIINKSSSPIAVIVSASTKVSDGMTDDLTYVANNATLDGTETDASIALSVTDGTNKADFATGTTNAEADAYFVLDAAATATQTYQSTDIEEGTGSHIYYQYYAPAKDTDYDTVSFTLVAKTSTDSDDTTDTDADTAWADYITSLTAENATVEKPTIDVVYTWETVTATTDSTSAITGYKNAAATNTYTATAPGWVAADDAAVTAAPAAPSISPLTYSVATGGDAVIQVNLGSGEFGATAITDVAIDWAGTWYSKNTSWGDETSTDFADDITIGTNTVTFNSTYTSEFAVGDTFEVYVVFDNDVDNALVTTITVVD